jgi:hypothetical protein
MPRLEFILQLGLPVMFITIAILIKEMYTIQKKYPSNIIVG